MKHFKRQGWSLMEAMIAVALFALLASSLVSLSVGALNPWLNLSGESQAIALADEGLEAVRTIQVRAWNELNVKISGLDWATVGWKLIGENSKEVIGDYTRQIKISSVCRDNSGQIASCPAAKTDPHMLLVTALVSWQTPAGGTKQVLRKTYLSNWDSRFWEQSNWIGGAGQSIWSDSNKYQSGQNIDTTTTGEVRLTKQAAQCQGATWTFDNPNDYDYDPTKIEISGGVAKLKQTRSYGLSDAPIGTANFTPSVINDFPSVVKVSDNITIPGIPGTVDVYAITSKMGTSCELVTMAISDSGLIRNPRLSSNIYENNNCNNPMIFKVSNNIFGLAHTRTTSNAGYLKTINIADNGTIGAMVDNYSFSGANISFPFVYKLPNQIYAMAYNNNGIGYLRTFGITDAGVISRNVISQSSLASNAQYFGITNWQGTVYAINYAEPAQYRVYVKTLNITTAGVISPIVSQYYVNASPTGYKTSFLKLGTTGALSYVDASNLAQLKTLAVDGSGNINQTPVDSMLIAGPARNATITWAPGPTGNHFLVSYNDTLSGSIRLLEINTANGDIGQVLDFFNYNLTNNYNTIFTLDSTHSAVAFRTTSSLGAVSTLAIEEGALTYIKNATISPKNLYTAPSVDSWNSFSVKATANSGSSIFYQLKTQTGTNWRYWSGSAWSTSAADTPNNTASDINNKIPLLETSSRSIGFKAVLQSNGTQGAELDEVKIDCRNLQFEAGTVSVGSNWQTVYLFNNYVDPVIIASVQKQNNVLPASTRVGNVGNNIFSVRLQNPDNSDLSNEQINYFVIESGLWRSGNLKIEAGKIITANTGSYAGWPYDTVNFKGGSNFFSASPIVFHQVMTNNDSYWINSYVSGLTSLSNPPDISGMRIGLNAAETATSHQSETIGWVAAERGVAGNISGINWESNLSGTTVRGYDDGCYAIDYQNNYSAPPITLVAEQTVNGSSEGSWAQLCGNSNSQASVQVDEDQVRDQERSHVAERVGLLSFANAFNYRSNFSGSYSQYGVLISSAFNMGFVGKTQVIQWLSSLPNNNTNIKFQIRTASDNGGVPGTWTAWYGADKENSFFGNPDGDLISADLNGKQWIQYKASLLSDGFDTPVLRNVKINYKQ